MPAVANKTESAFQLDEFYLDLQEDGSTIRILPKERVQAMPFPGLRPFKTSEFQLFNGRKGQARELIERLKQARFLGVIGSSGTGKTSLVRAGLIPELFGGSLREAGHRWNIAICRPGKNPIANLAIALSSIKVRSKDEDVLRQEYENIEALLNSSIYGLLEAAEQLTAGKPETADNKLMVIVDQFEELFRYERKDLGRQNIESHFVDLLLKAAANRGGSVYVIITMRSEFLGDCVKYRGLPEAINKGQYLVPALKRNEVKEAIEGPIHLAGKEIEPGLVELLVNEIEDNKLKENLDQLPILQHALMRTYQRAGDASVITYEHYKDIGQMQEALARHAREKFDALADPQKPDVYSRKQKIAKVIFQALTDASTDLKGGRRPTALKNIHAIAKGIGAGREEVNEVVDSFRDNETSFIMPPANVALHGDLIMDISHESLMRNWQELKDWVKEEVRNGVLYQRLNARREEEGQLIQGTLLADLLSWRDHCPHNAAWAARYHSLPDGNAGEAAHQAIYQQNIDFLRQSEEAVAAAAEREKQRISEEAKRQRDEEYRLEKVRLEEKARGRKRMLWVFGTAFLISIGLASWGFVEQKRANNSLVLVESQRNAANQAKEDAIRLKDSLAAKEKIAAEFARAALVQRDTAFAKEARIQDLLVQMTAANKQRELAEQLRNATLKESETRVAVDYLKNQPFYTESFLTNRQKDSIVDALLKARLTQQKPIDYSKYIRLDLQDRINAAIDARVEFMSYPIGGLLLAKSSWNENQTARNEWVDGILAGLFAKKVFPAQEVSPLLYQDSLNDVPYALAGQAGSGFALANAKQIVTGGLANGELALQNVYWTKPVPDNRVPNDSSARSNDSLAFDPFEARMVKALCVTNNGVLVLNKNGTLLRQRDGETDLLAELQGSDKLRLAEFSPDGNYLIAIKDSVLLLWNLASPSVGKKINPDTLRKDARTGTIKGLFPSPDGQTLLASFPDKKYETWNLGEKKPSAKFGNTPTGGAVGFTTDGNFMVVQYNNSYIDVFDAAGKRTGWFVLPVVRSDKSYSIDLAKQIAIAPDRRSLLINNGRSLISMTPTNKEPLFDAVGVVNRKVRFDTLYAFGEPIVDARYLNANTVVSLTGRGSLYKWMPTDTFSTLKQAFDFTSRFTDSSYEEKEAMDTLAFEKLLKRGRTQELREAGNHYFAYAAANGTYYDVSASESPIAKAKHLFGLLQSQDTGFFKRLDSAKLEALKRYEAYNEAYNKTRDSMERIRRREDTLNTISAYQADIISQEAQLKLDPSNEDLKKNIASNSWTLSWYLLCVQQYDSALYHANRCVVLYPKKDGAMTNVALAYLLKGDFARADSVYGYYHSKSYSDGSGKKFSDVFLQDFKDMISAGVITQSKPEVYNKMQEIKTKILGVK